MNGLQEIPLNAIVLSPHNPRRIDPDDPKIAELAKSIEASGLLQPVICRPDNAAYPDKYELLAGARRYYAHERLGRETILAIVRELDDQAAIEVTVLENLQRENLTPLEEGRGVHELLQSGKASADIAVHIGKSVAWVHRRAKLVDLIPEIAKACEDAKNPWSGVTAGHLEVVARLPKERQKKFFDDHDRCSSYVFEQTAWQWAEMFARDEMLLSKAPWGKSEESITNVPMCMHCPKRTDRQPELFQDDLRPETLAKTARCLDPECWQKKDAAHIQVREEELREEHGDRLLVVGRSRGMDEQLLGRKPDAAYLDTEKAKKSDPAARPALVIGENGGASLQWVKLRKGASEPKQRMPPRELRVKAAAVRMVEKALKAAPPPWQTVQAAAGFAVVFGTRDNERHRPDADTWERCEILCQSDETAIVLGAWNRVRPVLSNRIRMWDVQGCEPQYDEALRVAELIGLDQAALLQDADRAVPGRDAAKTAKTGKKPAKPKKTGKKPAKKEPLTQNQDE